MSVNVKIDGRGIVFNDQIANFAKNTKGTASIIPQLLADSIQDRQHQGRAIYHFWGGWDQQSYGGAGSHTTLTFARFNTLDGGCKSARFAMHIIPGANDLNTTAGVFFNGYQTSNSDIRNGTAYPTNVVTVIGPGAATDTDPAIAPGYPQEQTLLNDTLLRMSGCVFEDSIEDIVDMSTSVSAMGFSSDRDILGAQTGSYGTVASLLERATHVWYNRRPTFSWSCKDNLFVDFGEAPGSYRYIFDKGVGTGGTAPNTTGPAITLPLGYSGAGLDTGVRVYVWVLAAMSGSTDGGTIGIAKSDGTGTMSAFAALTNPQTVGGTGYAWYPSLGSFNPATAPYFVASTTSQTIRVLLGARSEGATDKIRIRSFMMAVVPV